MILNARSYYLSQLLFVSFAPADCDDFDMT